VIEKNAIQKSFWALTISETLEALETNQKGLMETEALAREKIFEKNQLPQRTRIAKLRIFLDQFKSPLISLLLVAGIITILVKDYKDAVVIFTATILNSLLGFYQENKAEHAVAHLRTYIKERVKVIREDREYEIEASELVPGDVVHFTQGDRVSADARIIYENNFFIDESILTGESLPVQKSTHPVSFASLIADQKCMAFSGTLVIQGFANAIVTATGTHTELGRIASLVQNHHADEETPLQKAIANFSIKASALLIFFTLIVFVIGVASGHSPLSMFLTSVAIIVAAIPEGLPIALTVILAVGVQRLAKKNGIIRKLLAVETLGNTTVILTDKTGTLTEAKMFLFRASVLNPLPNINSEFLLKIAVLNSDVIIENPKDSPSEWRLIGRPMESTIVRSAAQLSLNSVKLKKEMPVLEYLPFNSATKYSAALVQFENKKLLTVFGAPEILLKLSSADPDQSKNINREISKLASSGARVVGVAMQEVTDNRFHLLNAHTKLQGLTFLGVISFKDPIRSGVKEALKKIAQAGIKTVIVTGDHQGTAEAVARELGLPTKSENLLHGLDLDLMSDEILKSRLPYLTVISRVSPEGKVKIAKAYRDSGETVAMTGDGINDAPSLKQADIGIAMGSGTDVAKDVAELILLDDNYETIVAAIEEGRRTMENIRKVIVYLLSSILDELILIGGSLLAGLVLPINALQILWVNLFTDSFPAIALAFEDGIDHLSEKPRPLTQGLLDRPMRFLIFAIGIPSSLLIFSLYYVLSKLNYDPMLVRTFIFATFGTYSLFLVFAVRSLQKSIFHYNPFSNMYLFCGATIGISLMMISIYTPFFQNLLETVALPPLWLLGVFVVGLVNILAIEFGKLVIRRKLI